VPSFHRNLVSGILLNKAGLKTVVGVYNVVISCNGVFVGKRYLNRSLVVVNLVSEIVNENALSFAYIVESINLWHDRVGHVNFASIK